MEITKSAIAGTLESSDAQVTIEPAQAGLELEICSSVADQYGRQIKAVALETLSALGVKAAKVVINDKGALDCTIKARTECAVYRASGADPDGKVNWGGVK
ncbi:MAG: citrate lyase acyl carrier protein [Deferribacteraceae bacterium]|jgi:citrate lyase subunit gamma (acyl carrier protein)|nr:citrate lyase acyl carrier protein [Deferribacteraceae bacterium]